MIQPKKIIKQEKLIKGLTSKKYFIRDIEPLIIVIILFFTLFLANIQNKNLLGIVFYFPPQFLFFPLFLSLILIIDYTVNYIQIYKKQTSTISENQEFLIFVHDLKNMLMPALAYAEIGDIEKTRDKLYSICKKLNWSNGFDIKNQPKILLESLIKIKEPLIKSLMIEFNLNTYLFNLPRLNINDEDFCVLFGNILDNAIEACEYICEEKQRFINIEILNDKKYFKIIFENSFSKSLNDTTKLKNKTKFMHGYGLKSVNKILKKYKGELNCEIYANIFLTEIKIPII